MQPTEPSREERLLEFSYGSIWLVGACDPGELSPLALHALGSADAVIHGPVVSPGILELIQPPHYREIASPAESIERAAKLARDGWRIVRLFEADPLELPHAIECAAKFFEYGIPFRIIPVAGEPLIGEAPIGLLAVSLVRRTGPRTSETETHMVFVSIFPQELPAQSDSRWPMSAQRQRAPLGFSMSGLAG